MSGILFCAGLLFLFNPCVGMADPLPDAVGCLLIMAALRRAAVASYDAEEARRGFGRLAAASGVRLLALIFLTVLRSADSTLSLALSFAAVTVETVFFISAFRSFFASLAYAASRLEKPEPELDEQRRGAEVFTLVFAVLRAVMTVLPELGYLRGEEEMTVMGQIPFFARYRGILVAANVIFVGIAGLVWLVLCLRLVRSCKRSAALTEYSRRAYAEADPGEDYWRKRAFGTAFALLSAAAIFFADFYVDGISLLPDFIGAALICCAAFVLIKHGLPKTAVALPLLYFIFSAAAWALSVVFCGEYYGVATAAPRGAGSGLYKALAVSSALSALLFAVVWIYSAVLAYRCADGYLRRAGGSLDRRVIRGRRKLNGLFWLGSVLCLCDAVSGVLYYVFLFDFPEYHIVDVAIGAALVLACRAYYAAASDCLE